MKAALKKFIAGLPGGAHFLRAVQDFRTRKSLSRYQSVEHVFTHFYEENIWSDDESVSGPGSTAKYTENLRRQIPPLLAKLGVRTILDAPCGDYHWFRLIPRGEDVRYIGGDIVEPMIAKNETSYGNRTTSFRKIDITKDALPEADLWICRDCLIHFSDELIFQTLQNFMRSESVRYLLTSNHPNCRLNADIPTGSFRELNLRLPPFNFPEPLQVIDDWIEGFPVRQMGLWDRESVSRALTSAAAVS